MDKNTKIKQLFNTAFLYAVLGMIGGIFYREFTKFNDFHGETSLGFVHGHLFALGMLWFLILLCLELQLKLFSHKWYTLFYVLYNAGLAIITVTFVWRGITQVWLLALPKSTDAMISGIAGIGHILLGIGIFLFFGMLKARLK